jgi:tRNA A-37 threonylcarbamoyl transferase component Bud32
VTIESQKLEETGLISCAKCGAAADGCRCDPDLTLSYDPWIGKRINDQYEIVSLIARGGMGAVYRARHLLLATSRAIKVIRSDVHCDEVVYQRFKQEAQAVMGLSHPNIVGFHEFGIVGTTPYVVMDLIEGQSLDAAIKKDGRLEKMRALEIFMQVAAALQHAHSKGIFHRDIKPSNIMLVEDSQGRETVKVLDFGIAKIQIPGGQKLTSTGEVFGSPAYMSPEQGRGQVVDARSDIYSLGCVIYETICGKPPFEGANAIETIMKHMSEKPAPIYTTRGRRDFDPVIQDLEAIVVRCLEKEADKRYESMAALEDDLKRVSYGERLLNLHRNMAMRRRAQMLAKVHKYALIVFAVLLPVYAVYAVFVDPDSWRGQLASAIRYQDTADADIQQLIADLPKDKMYEWNRAYLIWNQAQITRLKSAGNPALLPQAIFKYESALEHLKEFKTDDGANPRLRRGLCADCYDGLCRSYLQALPTYAAAGARAKVCAEKAVNLRRESIQDLGTGKDTAGNLCQSLALLAQARTALNGNPRDVDRILSEESELLRLYDPGSWQQSECFVAQAENALRLGLKTEAIQKLEEALKIQASLYGAGSPEVGSLWTRIQTLKGQTNTPQSNRSAR